MEDNIKLFLNENETDISNNMDLSNNNVCPISLDTFRTGDVLCQIVGCGHTFKYNALMYWLRRHSSCPVCRYNLHNYREGDQPSTLDELQEELNSLSRENQNTSGSETPLFWRINNV